MRGAGPLNSSVSFSSHVSEPCSPGMSTTELPPGAFFGGGGRPAVRTLTMKVRAADSPAAVVTDSTIRRRDSALTVVAETAWSSPNVTVTR